MTGRRTSSTQGHETAHQHYWSAVRQVKDHKFITLIIASISVSLFLVFAAMALYKSSGAQQLDLSRPGYEEVRTKAQKDETETVSYSASGTLDKAALKEFDEKYNSLLNKAKQQDTFSSDLLNIKSLQIDQETTAATQPQQPIQ